RIALRVGAQLVEAHRGGLEIAQEMLQALPGRTRGPSRREEPRELRTDVGDCIGRCFFRTGEALLQRRAFGLDRGGGATDVLRDEREAVAALFEALGKVRRLQR